MKVSNLLLALWWLFAGIVVVITAGIHFNDGFVWRGVLHLAVSALAFRLFLNELCRIDRD